MAKRRREPPRTPLGVWLLHWLEEHPEVTHQALAERLGVSRGVISQWISGEVRTIKATNLRKLSEVTGEPLENLETMVYGSAGQRRVAETPGIYVTEAELEALLERAADTAMRRLLDEMGGARGE